MQLAVVMAPPKNGQDKEALDLNPFGSKPRRRQHSEGNHDDVSGARRQKAIKKSTPVCNWGRNRDHNKHANSIFCGMDINLH